MDGRFHGQENEEKRNYILHKKLKEIEKRKQCVKEGNMAGKGKQKNRL